MLVTYPFNPKDEAQALKNAVWLSEMTTPGKHKALLVYDSRCNPKGVSEALSKSFQILDTLKVNDYYNKWCESANLMFEQAARLLEYKYPQEKYFLFLEPDAILIQKDGLDKLEAEFLRGKKPFMGACVPRFVDNKGGVSPEHLSGNAIYPNPIVSFAGAMLLSSGEPTPFDLIATEAVNPQSHFTDMIQHRWSPPFNPNPPFTSMEDIRSRMTSECVLYHSDKTGSIINVLAAGMEKSKSQAGTCEALPEKPSPKPAVQLTLKERRQAQAARMREAKKEKKLKKHIADNVPKGYHLADDGWAYVWNDWKEVSAEKQPWEDKFESLGEINKLAQRLYRFCDAPMHTKRVRDELRKVGVIR